MPGGQSNHGHGHGAVVPTARLTTVGDYLATRLAQIGVKHHFVVPGD
jgi:hypothetical protein